jgi:hypothetical protein
MDSSFDYWWETYFCAPAHGLTKEHMKEAYVNGFNTCRDKWSGLDYEQTIEFEGESHDRY